MSRPAKFVRFAPVAVLFAAAFTQACTAETTEVVHHPAAKEEAAQNDRANDVAERLSGNAYTSADKNDIGAGLDQVNAGWPSDVAAQMVVPGLKAPYEIVSYTLGIEASANALGSASGTASAQYGRVSALEIRVKRNDGLPSLTGNVFTGKPIGDVVLVARPKAGTKETLGTKLMTLTNATIVQGTTSSSQTYVDEAFIVRFSAIEIAKDDVSVRFDLVAQTASLSGKCLEPSFIDSAMALPLGAPEIRIDSINVAVSNETDPSGYGASRPKLGGIAVGASFGKEGLCAAFNAWVGKPSGSPKIAVQGPAYGKNLIEWSVCTAFVRGVTLSASGESTFESLDLDAAGLVRTDRSFDIYGKQSAISTTGWSFVRNAAIATCGEAL